MEKPSRNTFIVIIIIIIIISVFGLLSCLMQCHGFDPPLRRIFPVEGIFPLELTWVLTPFHKNFRMRV